MFTFNRILVATDFGEASERALELALELAARFDSELTLVHIWEFPSFEYLDGLPTPNEFAEHVAEAARARMDATIRTIEPRHANVRSIVKMGIVWLALLHAAEEAKSDLIVLGTHGRRGIKRAILGSVAEKLVRLAHVPVLTVHGEDEAK